MNNSDLETFLPGLTASGYKRIDAAQTTIFDRLVREWQVIIDDTSSRKRQCHWDKDHSMSEALIELYDVIAQECWNAYPDQEAFLRALEHVNRYVKQLPHPNQHWSQSTWGDYWWRVETLTAGKWELKAIHEKGCVQDKPPKESIAARLAGARAAAGHSVEAAGIEIAELAGLQVPYSQKTVERWEKGHVKKIRELNRPGIEKYIKKYLLH